MSCDPFLLFSDAITCSSCGLSVLKPQYEKHTFSCTQNLKEEYISEDLPVATFESSGIEDNIVDTPNENIDNDEVRNCKSVLGSCIMIDKGESCVCAQISKTVDEEYDFTPIDNEPINMSKVNNKVSNFCEGCECSERCNVPNGSTDAYRDNTPVIEYKADGTVKLKDIFEMDIPPVKTVKAEVGSVNTDVKFVPYNSCKAVLGNCIVSGNGMMGEGCLCARMILDEQVTAQEIDDITPRPKDEMFCD